MDSFLTDYVASGRAWVLIGSGPSIEMGYPSSKALACSVLQAVQADQPQASVTRMTRALERQDYPRVFEEAELLLGGPRLLQVIRAELSPSSDGKIYKMLARWPVPVYLTTNYDDEIQANLAHLGEAYQVYSNSEDHFADLLPELNGVIVKLHGDLRSQTGLILTATQYTDIAETDRWKYWRTKMTSVFQMNRVIVIGHSLTDTNIRHVLEAAKRGSGVQQPICWIAPNVSPETTRTFLEQFRIRVIPYDNQDGTHRNLVRLIETVSEFVPPRTAIHIRQQIADVSRSTLGDNAAAPGFFVFNKLAIHTQFDDRRMDVALAVLQSALSKLASIEPFTLDTALTTAGWPQDFPLHGDFAQAVAVRAIEQGLLVSSTSGQFRIGEHAQSTADSNRKEFERMRERFKQSLQLRARQRHPDLSSAQAEALSDDIEASLTGYFKACGLTLATTLFAGSSIQQGGVPRSILKFISEASARYNDLLMRQAFCTVTVDAFVHGGSAERDYLGRVSQGFFAFHAVGVFGDVAKERFQQAKETVWLIDSDSQVPLLALAAPSNRVFTDYFTRLRESGIRLFTTETLLRETFEHLWFANRVVRENGPDSPYIIAASRGDSPFRKSNQFLEGFVRWQAAGNSADWKRYLYDSLEEGHADLDAVRRAVQKKGIEVIDFQDWPGFTQQEFASREQYVEILKLGPSVFSARDPDEAYKKALPEAEALVIVTHERKGQYHIISEVDGVSPCWFISHTAILNTIGGTQVTWPPEAFLRFISTLSTVSDDRSTDRAFETVLWGLAQSGLSLIDMDMVANVFGGVIDQTTLRVSDQRQVYQETIAKKYGEPIEAVLERIPPLHRPLAAIQLANEMAQAQTERLEAARQQLASEKQRGKLAEKELKDLEHFRKKMEAKRNRGRTKARKGKGRKGRKGGQKKKKEEKR